MADHGDGPVTKNELRELLGEFKQDLLEAVDPRLERLRAEMLAGIDALRQEMLARMNALREEMLVRIDALREELIEKIQDAETRILRGLQPMATHYDGRLKRVEDSEHSLAARVRSIEEDRNVLDLLRRVAELEQRVRKLEKNQ